MNWKQVPGSSIELFAPNTRCGAAGTASDKLCYALRLSKNAQMQGARNSRSEAYLEGTSQRQE